MVEPIPTNGCLNVRRVGNKVCRWSPKETLASGPPKETRASAGAAQGNASDSVRALLKAAAQPQGFGAAQCSCLTPASIGDRLRRTSWPVV